MEEVSRISGYFGFGTSAYLHWKLLYFSALFIRTDFGVAWVIQKRSTLTISLPRLEFGIRSSRLRKFGSKTLKFKACTAFASGTHPYFPLYSSPGGCLELYTRALSPSLTLSPIHLFSLPHFSWFIARRSKPPPPTAPHPREIIDRNPRSPLDHPCAALVAGNSHSPPETSIIAENDNGLEMGRNQTEAHEGLLDLVEEVDRSRLAPEPLHLVAGDAPSSRSKAATTEIAICSTAPLCHQC